MQKTKVLAVGTFDVFHEGHRFFLQSAKNLGDELFVIVARDETVKQKKGFFPHENEQERQKKVQNAHIADHVFLGSLQNFLELPEKIAPQIFAAGYDQNVPEDALQKILPNLQIIRIPSHFPEKFKSSILLKR